MLKPIFEGNLDIFVKTTTTATAGQLVKLTADGVVAIAGAGDVVHGFIAQDVISGNVDNYKLDSVTHKARIGDKVGVYYKGGMYTTDQYSGNVTAGAPLYSGANGQLVLTVSGNIVAYAENNGNSANGDKLRIKSIVG